METKQELLEIYKLHAELADRVSQRREGANRLYVSLLSVMVVFLAAFLRYRTGTISVQGILIAAGVLGMVLSASWFFIIRSYCQLNAGKFKALQKLEEMLVFAFFKCEWEILERGKNKNRYWRLTGVEKILPIGFFVASLLLILLAIVNGQLSGLALSAA
ncbi:MAG: hypothetical protein M2R45_01270 [Verrucomicrobia subdivision 3 bacterium]|nr:hypothetical protein [Limisphaerales bacterium]MCS1415136.1 hypothetical protein [Limisphaerales bacterium]